MNTTIPLPAPPGAGNGIWSGPAAATSTRGGSAPGRAGIATTVAGDDVVAFMFSTGLSPEVAHCSRKLPAGHYAATDQALAWRRRDQ